MVRQCRDTAQCRHDKTLAAVVVRDVEDQTGARATRFALIEVGDEVGDELANLAPSRNCLSMALASRSAFEGDEKPFKPDNAASPLKFISDRRKSDERCRCVIRPRLSESVGTAHPLRNVTWL